MKLKCETTLNIYEHKDKLILCRVKVLPRYDKINTKIEDKENTCRYITREQWCTFDKELSSLFDLEENDDCELDEQLRQFSIKPNLEVKIQKSKLSVNKFYQCVRNCPDNYEELDVKNCTRVFDCRLEYKAQTNLLAAPTISADEYEPLSTTTGIKNESTNPLSYEPYTPSKRKRQFSIVDKIKTPGLDFLGFGSIDDTYSPKPLALTANCDDDGIITTETHITIPKYKPAPISERKRTSQDSLRSALNEEILETDDELLRHGTHRSIRKKVKIKCQKNRDQAEYIPESQDIADDIPAYNPTPIEDRKQNIITVPKEIETIHKIEPCLEKKECEEDIIKHKKRKKDKQKADGTTKDTKPDTSNTSFSSGEEFEKNSSKRRERDKDSRDGLKSGSSKHRDKDSKHRVKSKLKENGNERYKENQPKPHDKRSGEKKASKSSTSQDAVSTETNCKDVTDHPSVRRSVRSPSKPKRLIEEMEKYDSHKKPKSHKDLFGTDDDEDADCTKRSDSNNNASNKSSSVFHTPKPDKKTKSAFLSSSSSSSSKKKRKRNDCEQEKSDLSKWLSKSKSNAENDNKITSESSKSSKSSAKEISTKKVVSSKEEKRGDRSKSVSPQPPMEIVMPSKEELELMRTKHKLQREENEKLKAALEKINEPPPKEVEQLSLKDMTLNELLDTFTNYKKYLDDIYEKNRKKNYVEGYNGVNHCLVIGLVDQRIQLTMMEKLVDIYSSTKSSLEATLYANALLPEWIIRVFMGKYNLTRLEAIKQIENQDAYQAYLDGQNENSFIFD